MKFILCFVLAISALAYGEPPLPTTVQAANCQFFNCLADAENGAMSDSTTMICILSYEKLGDSPPRWMMRLPSAPTPVQPWHVVSSGSVYWQDCGSDFYPEFLGATVNNPDCSTALQDAFRAHLFLKMRLRGMGNTYTCLQQVHLDTAGFSNGGCDVDMNGVGRSTISFAPNVPAPCFLLASSVAQNDFWGRFVNLEIDANVNGIAAQFGRADFADPSNDFELWINVKNNSTESAAQGLVINAFYSSPFNVVANCGASGTGQTALQLNRCNMCSGFLAAGHCNTGLAFANYTNGNAFSVDLEVVTTGIVQLDSTCAYNEILCGIIANVTDAIDNHKGGPLRLRNIPLGGNKNIFANASKNDDKWGGFGVTLDDTGQNPTNFSPDSLKKQEWVLNKSGQPQWVSIFGTHSSKSFEVRIRPWHDFKSDGTAISKAAPCAFLLQPGEQVWVSDSKDLSWTWRPL